MYDQDTGLYRDGNVPYEHRDTFFRETGYMNPRETTNWEKELIDAEMKALEREDLED